MRRQNGWPTPPAPSTLSQLPPTAVVPTPLPVFEQLKLFAAPVVSRRPMTEVTGPKPPTVPMAHRASRSAHGLVHWPRKTLPKPPCTPTAEFREAKPEVWATLFERSSAAFVSTWNHADRPPPRVSRPRTPTFDAALVTSHLLTSGLAVWSAASLCFQQPKLMFK